MKTSFELRREKQIPPLGRNDKADLWAPLCATVGAAVWAGLAVLARLGAIELLLLFAPLVIVPLGMELSRGIGGKR
jgi:hypothetical protein